MGLVCDLNLIMAQMPPLFNDNQYSDESEIVDSLANKAPRAHMDMMLSQGFNSKTGYIETFVEHCKQAETTDNISMANFPFSDYDSGIMNIKKCSKKTK